MRTLAFAVIAGALASSLVACGGDAAPPTASDTSSDTPAPAPAALGAPCAADADCISGVCLSSTWSAPFCSRACTSDGEACPGGEDAQAGASQCVSFATLPNPNAPPFVGELDTFCIPGCTGLAQCTDVNADWETCDVPRWLGDQLYPSWGNVKVCSAPSFQGADEPVDPALCDWEKLIEPGNPTHASQANQCRKYCEYLERCKVLPQGARTECCAWGCFNLMEVEGKLNDPWEDEVKCFVSEHAKYNFPGSQRVCAQEPVECDTAPEDPTPAAATGP